ncbi:SKN-1 protein [Aphelenchoides avenae]|nr:SKN-1 protein [Aphelenchus avenae]
MPKAAVKEDAPKGHLVNSIAAVVKEEPPDFDVESGNDNEDRNTPTEPSLPCSDRLCNLRKRTTPKRTKKEDVGTMEPTVVSSNVEGEWTEMESVVIDEESLSVKVELPSIWDEGEVEQGSSAGMPTDQGKLKCAWPKCGYTTSRLDSMKRHQAVHDYAQRSYTCEMCGKGFTAKHCLDGHMAVHSDGKTRVTSQNPRRRGRQSKDEELAAEHALPVSAEKLAAMTYQEVQRLLIDHPKLIDAQKVLIRKIRRRGRNKLAARKSRERRVQDRHTPIAHDAQTPIFDDHCSGECCC